ncbi:YozE family protein [Pseudoduganella sp. SL102]|uniref:YozE family protein n=1 Tax=Pseudoduganella sp. SL102 TaxID=2995154 RepID=UPI00248BC4A2|nr:YozE family protein [Pseudoduganella sp. SL102]WBS02380.1 YozE family protein [Pseudoduganella sp. SL102]
MKIEIEIPDTPELEGIPDDDMARIIDEAVRGLHLYEYSGEDVDLTDARARVTESAWTRKPAGSFRQWLRTQKNRDDIVGDLARDVLDDSKAPSGRLSKGEWRDYLGGRDHLVNALDEAWAQFAALTAKNPNPKL